MRPEPLHYERREQAKPTRWLRLVLIVVLSFFALAAVMWLAFGVHKASDQPAPIFPRSAG